MKKTNDYGDLSNFDRRLDRKKLTKELNFIKSKISKEGWEIICKFVKGAAGANRSWIITHLYELIKGKRTLLTFSQIDSYTNKDLRELVKTGDFNMDASKKLRWNHFNIKIDENSNQNLFSSPSRTYIIPVFRAGSNCKEIYFKKFTLPKKMPNTCSDATWYFYNRLDSMSCGKDAYPIEMHNNIVEIK